MQILAGLIILVCIAALIWMLLALGVTVRCLRRPRRHSMVRAISMGHPVDPEEAGWHADSWTVSCDDGIQMPVWSIKTTEQGPVTILIHDWGESRIDCLPLLSEWSDSEMIVMPDLRGHGESEGFCTFGRLEISDIENLIEVIDVRNIRIVGYGYAANLVSRIKEPSEISLERVCHEPWTRDELPERLGGAGLPVELPGWLLGWCLRLGGVLKLVDQEEVRG